MEYRQNSKAIGVSYACGRWLLALLTYGILCAYDVLNYKNTRLIFSDKFLIFETGAFTKKSKEISYEDIQSVRAEQSFFGQHLGYGTVIVSMKNGGDTMVFKHANRPEAVRKAVQDRFISSTKFKAS